MAHIYTMPLGRMIVIDLSSQRLPVLVLCPINRPHRGHLWMSLGPTSLPTCLACLHCPCTHTRLCSRKPRHSLHRVAFATHRPTR